MDNVNLSDGESVIFRAQSVIISGVPHEAVLTSRRLILVESETGVSDKEIPLSDISLVVPGMNTLREPTLTILKKSTGGEMPAVNLIFAHQAGGLHLQVNDRFLMNLKKQNIPVQGGATREGGSPLRQSAGTKPGDLVVDELASRSKTTDFVNSSIPRANRQTPPEPVQERSILTTIVAIILIIGIIVAVAFVAGQVLNAKTTPAQQSPATTQTTPGVISTPPPSPPPTPEVTLTAPVTTASVPEISIPPTGVWIQVQYPGNFSGSLGARGRTIPVSGSGTKFYQIPIVNGTIDGSLGKMDGSGDPLTIRIYRDGILIAQRITVAPYGLVDFHVTGPEEIIELATPVPTPVPQVRYEYLPAISIPTTGIWVRVYYPGSYSGSAGGKGIFTQIQNSGDQVYRMPDYSAVVEGSVEKQDGSAGRMVVEIYNNGTLLSRSETMKPEGLIDFHVTV